MVNDINQAEINSFFEELSRSWATTNAHPAPQPGCWQKTCRIAKTILKTVVAIAVVAVVAYVSYSYGLSSCPKCPAPSRPPRQAAYRPPQTDPDPYAPPPSSKDSL